jgi:hypothetical protein
MSLLSALNAERRYAECRYAECRYAEGRGATFTLTMSHVNAENP